MARRTAAALQDDTTEDQQADPSPASMVPELPEDFTFTVSENVAIPEAPRAERTAQHPFATHYGNMGHNSSFFVPVAYWVHSRGRELDKTPFACQKNAVGLTFTAWKKRGTEAEVEAKKKWRLVTIARNLGEDPEFPQYAGLRCWKVDTSR